MQPELALDEAELCRRDQPAVRHANAEERAVEIGVPEIEEVEELGEVRGEVVVLPDIALQQLRVVRQPVEDFRRGGLGSARASTAFSASKRRSICYTHIAFSV